MPEPFSGKSARLKIAIVGINPGFDACEDKFPTINTPVDKAYKFFSNRFARIRNRDGTLNASTNSYWAKIEAFFREILPDFRLGQDALLIEVIRFKSAGQRNGPSSKEWNKAFNGCEREALIKTVQTINADIFVTLGGDAAYRFHQTFGFTTSRPRSADYGKIFYLKQNVDRIQIRPNSVLIPMYHPADPGRKWESDLSRKRAKTSLRMLLADRGRLDS